MSRISECFEYIEAAAAGRLHVAHVGSESDVVNRDTAPVARLEVAQPQPNYRHAAPSPPVVMTRIPERR